MCKTRFCIPPDCIRSDINSDLTEMIKRNTFKLKIDRKKKKKKEHEQPKHENARYEPSNSWVKLMGVYVVNRADK